MVLKISCASIYLSHGGGPLPLLGDESHEEMVKALKDIAAAIERPRAILLVSAHWQEDVATLTSGQSPSLIYDYYGFPAEAYQISYPVAGHPRLARRAADLLSGSCVQVSLDDRRGFDHGFYIPLKIMYPEADIPCVQLSLLTSLSPRHHIEMGRALAPLQQENVLVIGSGFSFHNLRAFFSPSSAETMAKNEAFETWLNDACANPEYGEEMRQQRLQDWQSAPAARFCHPTEEHLIPLHFCYGVANRPAYAHYAFNIMGKMASVYLWQREMPLHF